MNKIFIISIILLFLSCSLDKVIKHHGVNFLEKKQSKLEINNSNKNDVNKILGPPSTVSKFDNDVWIYIERKTTVSNISSLGKKKLLELIEKFKKIEIRDKTNIWNTEVIEALELENLLLQSLVSIESALNRKESRGAHSRVDYKKRNDKSWLKHTMAWVNNNKKPKIRYRPVNLKTNSKEIKTIEPKVRVY